MRTFEKVVPDTGVVLGAEVPCECMVCDLPEGSEHGPVRWNAIIAFPGPYPPPGEAAMLLCDHCKDDWVHGEWEPPFDNFLIMHLIPV